MWTEPSAQTWIKGLVGETLVGLLLLQSKFQLLEVECIEQWWLQGEQVFWLSMLLSLFGHKQIVVITQLDLEKVLK